MMLDFGLLEVVSVVALLVVVSIVDALVLLAVGSAYDRYGWSVKGLALAGGAVVLAGQAVLSIWALRAWSLLWASGPDSPFRGPGFVQLDLAPSEVVRIAAPYMLGVIGASAVMLVGASIIGLAVWKSSRRELLPSPTEVSVTSEA